MEQDEFLHRRLGRFCVHRTLFEGDLTTIRKIMDQVIVMEATYLTLYQQVQFAAMSPHFAVVEQGHVVPEYRCVIEQDGSVGFR